MSMRIIISDLDRTLLRAAGTGIAVANALDEAKTAADEICDENDADGVAKWIEQNILNTLGR